MCENETTRMLLDMANEMTRKADEIRLVAVSDHDDDTRLERASLLFSDVARYMTHHYSSPEPMPDDEKSLRDTLADQLRQFGIEGIDFEDEDGTNHGHFDPNNPYE